jgi:SAM-dependent methyltransferase
LKEKRDQRASAELNALEHAWWEQNAGLVARFWEMEDGLSRIIRKAYLNRARRFFVGGKKLATVLELGCGSGWVGQMLARPDLRIVGTDFSAAQIKLAVANARRKGLEAYTKYSVASSAEWPAEAGRADGVLIHAFLHHLDQDEIDRFFDDLIAIMPGGTKVWLLEPAFHNREPGPPGAGKWRSKILVELATIINKRLTAFFRRRGDQNEEAREEFLSLARLAQSNGWYLSPKEVPFEVDEFTSYLTCRMDVRAHYWVVINAVGWAFESNLVRKKEALRVAKRWAWPLLSAIDRILARDQATLKQQLRPPAYAFHVWECALR